MKNKTRFTPTGQRLARMGIMLLLVTGMTGTGIAALAPSAQAASVYGSNSYTVGRNADGRMQLFAMDNSGRVLTAWQTTVITSVVGAWSSWNPLGPSWLTTNGPIATYANQDGRMQVFTIGRDSQLYTACQTKVNGGWLGWNSMGGTWGINYPTNVSVYKNKDGRLQVFLLGGDGAMWTKWQTSINGGWSGWGSMGGNFRGGYVTVGANQDGRMQVFAVGADNQLYTKWQTVVNGAWSGWGSMGGNWSIGTEFAVSNNKDGRLQVFAVGTDGQMHTSWQTKINGGWSSWGSMGGSWQASWGLGVGRNADGRMQLFAIGRDDQLYTAWQTTVNGGWSGWSSMGGTWPVGSTIAVSNSLDGREQVFIVGTNGAMYTKFQTVINGGWSTSWGQLSALGVFPVKKPGEAIVAKALELAWPDRSHKNDDPKPAYKNALVAVGLNTHPDPYVKIGASCDAFVATVMRTTVDPNYQCCGAFNQLTYLSSNPSKYTRITNLGNTSNLLPGDIFVSNNHTLFYIGNGQEASASRPERTADYGRAISYRDSAGIIYQIYRFRG